MTAKSMNLTATERLIERIQLQWEIDPVVREGFGGDFEVFSAFCHAEAKGLTTLFSSKKPVVR